MRIILRTAVVGVALALSFGLSIATAQDPIAPAQQIEVHELWFVELEGAPSADGRRRNDVRAEQAAFRRAAAQAGIEFQELRSFQVLFNGFSVRAAPAERALLSTLPGVANIWPVEVIEAPRPPTDGALLPDLATAIEMTRADFVHDELGYTGAGVRVAVMDTGIDYDHADLGGDGIARSNSDQFPNSRVVAGWDFVGDDYTGPTGPPPVPDPFPDDCQGHGTHVAGIVGANGVLVGVAPDVQLGAYRVFGCEGNTSADIMLEAMERALADGMHVLNMSIGIRAQWPQYPTGAAATRLQNLGMVVVASTGNNGPGAGVPDGPYAAGAPGIGHDVIGVASYDNVIAQAPAFTINPGDHLIPFTRGSGVPTTPTSGTLPLAQTDVAGAANDGCEAEHYDGFPSGHVALVRRGTCFFYYKAINAENAGAPAVVLYNNQPGLLTPNLAPEFPGQPPVTIPVVMVTQVDGNLIVGIVEEGPTTLTWGTQTASAPVPTGGLISGFSSFGMAADLTLKPDIGAPGGSIFSTIPLELGSHGSNSGTSMSAPHVAGAVALLRQAEPNLPASAVRDRLQNSAKPSLLSVAPHLGLLEVVHRQGAGMLDIADAITAGVSVTPGKLSLGESEAGPQTRQLTIRNLGGADVTLDLSLVNAVSTGPKNPANFANVGYFVGGASAVFSAASVTVQPGQSATVDVTITAPANPNQGQYGGYVVLADQENGRDYRVPFAGFIGDYQTVQVLTDPGFMFGNPILRPALAFGPNEPMTFNPDEGEVAWLLIHRSHQLRYWEFRILHAGTMQPIHPVFANFQQDEFVGRNLAATSFSGFAWDGTRIHSAGASNVRHAVPNGDYVIQLRILKALGDPANPDHWEIWNSPVVTIERTASGPGKGPVVPPRGR
jgi:minor extracellular serine protease Vpr